MLSTKRYDIAVKLPMNRYMPSDLYIDLRRLTVGILTFDYYPVVVAGDAKPYCAYNSADDGHCVISLGWLKRKSSKLYGRVVAAMLTGDLVLQDVSRWHVPK